MAALEEIMAGMGIVHIEGHQAQCIKGVDLALIMAVLIALPSTNIMVCHMIDIGVLSMEGITGRFVSDKIFIFLLFKLARLYKFL